MSTVIDYIASFASRALLVALGVVSFVALGLRWIAAADAGGGRVELELGDLLTFRASLSANDEDASYADDSDGEH